MDIFLLNKAPDFSEKNVAKIKLSKSKAGALPSSKVKYPAYGDLYGKVTLPRLSIDEPLFLGDDLDILSLGAGQYIGSVFPGEKGTTLIGAHSLMSGFGKLQKSKVGDTIVVKTTYGTYKYKVKEKKVLKHDSPRVNKALAKKDKDRLLLYTCHPVGVLGLTENRLFIFAEYQSGPVIDQNA